MSAILKCASFRDYFEGIYILMVVKVKEGSVLAAVSGLSLSLGSEQLFTVVADHGLLESSLY